MPTTVVRRKVVKERRLCAADIEIGLVDHLGERGANIFVPNVSFGLFDDRHEADLVQLTRSHKMFEYEIKCSAADIHKDTLKQGGRGHALHRFISELWFVVPQDLANNPEIPKHAGILAYAIGVRGSLVFRAIKAPKLNRNRVKLSQDIIMKFLRLGCFRIWTLKKHLQSKRGGSLYVEPRIKGRAKQRRR